MKISPDLVLDESDWIPSDAIGPGLDYVQKWPAEHWKLAFQGNLHRIPDEDFETLRACARRRLQALTAQISTPKRAQVGRSSPQVALKRRTRTCR